MTPDPSHAARIPPTSADGRVRNDRIARRVLPNDACSSRNTPMDAAIANSSSRSCAFCRSWNSPSSSGWYPCGNGDARQGGLDVGDDRAEVASADVRVDVDPPSGLLVVDVAGRRRDRDVRDRLERHLAAGRRVDQEVLDIRDAAATLRDAPDDDVVRLAGVEDVADLLAGDIGGGDAPDVAGLHAVLLRLGQVDLDLDLRDVDQLLGVQVDDARDRRRVSPRRRRPDP